MLSVWMSCIIVVVFSTFHRVSDLTKLSDNLKRVKIVSHCILLCVILLQGYIN